MNEIFLTGYQNSSLKKFIKKLKDNGITIVVDIRELPLSRKKGFSKTQLINILKRSGMGYEHIAKLGSPRLIRHELRKEDGDYITFFNKYRTYVRGRHFEIQKIIDMAKTEVICIMCFEEDCELCHRTIVADEIQKIMPQAKIQAI